MPTRKAAPSARNSRVSATWAIARWAATNLAPHQRRVSTAHLEAIHDVAIKAALKDQERAGIDVPHPWPYVDAR